MDILRVPPEDRHYIRYVYWPEGWPLSALLTLSVQALLSDQGSLPEPVEVSRARLFRLDMRESGWDRRREVWEKLADLDFVFRQRYRFQVPADIPVFGRGPPPRGAVWFKGTADYREGWYRGDTLIRPGSRAAYRSKHVAPGGELKLPAVWANPPVPVGKGTLGRAQDELRMLLDTELPVTFGPWWMVQVQRQIDTRNRDDTGAGYFDFLGVKDRDSYFDLAGLDKALAVRRFAQLQEVVRRSGISGQNRQVVVFRGASGEVVGTLDPFDSTGRGLAVRNLRPGEFKHNAERWIAHLPTGLPLFGLFDKDGVLQASAPDRVGGNTSGLRRTNDLRIHPDTCVECHGVSPGHDMVVPFKQWARERFRKDSAWLIDPKKPVRNELRSLYLRDLDGPLDDMRRRFARSVALLGRTKAGQPQLTVAGWTRMMREAVYQYTADPVTLDVAVAEMGGDKDSFLKNLRRLNATSGGSDLVLVDFLDSPAGALPRMDWEDSWQLAKTLEMGVWPPSVIVEVKK